MSAKILSFLRRPEAPRDWSAQELAEFYRVEAALIQTGLRAVSARGLSDEGEPWFVFCRAEDDEVIIHFARIDGRYVISAPTYCGTATGSDFRALVRSTIERHPVLRPHPAGDNLYLHPTALLVALVASALLKSGHAAEAATGRQTAQNPAEAKYRGFALLAAQPALPTATQTTGPHQETVILAALAAALTSPAKDAPVTITVSAHSPLVDTSEAPHIRFAGVMPSDDSREFASHVAGSSAPASPLIQPISPLPADVSIPHLLAQTMASADPPLHAVPLPDGAAVLAAHVAVLPEAHPVPAEPAASAPIIDPMAGAHHVPLSALTSIPKADVDLLRALGVSDTVAYVNTIPAALSAVLQDGAHTAAATFSAGHATAPEPASHAAATASKQSAAAPAAPAAGSDSSASAATAHNSGFSTPDSAATHIVAATTPQSAPAMADVLDIVKKFQAVEIHPVVLMTDHSAIFYDADAVTFNLPSVHAVTYDFGDGFSISLVGLPNELAQVDVHVR